MIKPKEYSIEEEQNARTIINIKHDQEFSFLYCVSYRDPNLPEWILARGYWNDEGIWTPDGIFPM